MSTVFPLDRPAPSLLTMVWPMLSLSGWRSSRRCWSTAHSNITRYTHILHSLSFCWLFDSFLLVLLLTFEHLLLLFHIIIIYLYIYFNIVSVECLSPFSQTAFLVQEANKFIIIISYCLFLWLRFFQQHNAWMHFESFSQISDNYLSFN